MPDWRFQPCDFPRMAFFLTNGHESNRNEDRIRHRRQSRDGQPSKSATIESSVKLQASRFQIDRATSRSQIRRRFTCRASCIQTFAFRSAKSRSRRQKRCTGEIEMNEPVRVYDTSGPWGDADFHGDVTQGLPPLRAKWIRERGDVEEIKGREVQPIDDGYLSEKHAAIAAQRSTPNSESETQRPTFNGAGAPSRRRPLRASVGHPVTQLAYARRGIITPEMEFIAIREKSVARAGIGDPAPTIDESRLQPERSPFPPLRLATNRNWKSQIRKSRSLPNSSAPKSRAAAPSFPQTSIIPNPSR